MRLAVVLRRGAKLRDQRKDAVAVSSSVLEPARRGSHDRILEKKLHTDRHGASDLPSAIHGLGTASI